MPSSLNFTSQLIAQLAFVAILPYLNPDGISRGSHVDSGGTEFYEYGPGEYMVEQEYHTDYYGNRYGKYDRKDDDKKNKLLNIELQKPLDIDFDGDKPSVTLQKPIVSHLDDEDEEDYHEEEDEGTAPRYEILQVVDDEDVSHDGEVIYLGSTLKRFKGNDRGKNSHRSTFVILDKPSKNDKEEADPEEDNTDETNAIAAEKLSSSIRDPIQ